MKILFIKHAINKINTSLQFRKFIFLKIKTVRKYLKAKFITG